MRTSFLLAAAALALSAAPTLARHPFGTGGEADLAKALAGKVAGAPVKCIQLDTVDGSQIFDGAAIIYHAIGGRDYVNRPRGAEYLREDDVLVNHVYGTELCNLDRVTLLDRTTRMQRGFVGLNDFVPYTKPGKGS